MKCLAIDTSAGLSVGLTDGANPIVSITRTDHGVQGELTADFIQRALNQANWSVAEITDVVVGVGPGPYTGLRVGIITAQLFAHARKLPIHAICSLDALGFADGDDCVTVIDARRKELYFAEYRNGQRCTEPGVMKPNELANKYQGTKFVGPGVEIYPELIEGKNAQLNAVDLAAAFANGIAQPVKLAPMYLRKPDAHEPAARKPVKS